MPHSSAHAQKMTTAKTGYFTRANPYYMLIQCRCPAKRFLMILIKSITALGRQRLRETKQLARSRPATHGQIQGSYPAG